MLKNIMKGAIEELQRIKETIPKDVEEASFEAALDGIQSGKMDY